jgi:hypothetical protein
MHTCASKADTTERGVLVMEHGHCEGKRREHCELHGPKSSGFFSAAEKRRSLFLSSSSLLLWAKLSQKHFLKKSVRFWKYVCYSCGNIQGNPPKKI